MRIGSRSEVKAVITAFLRRTSLVLLSLVAAIALLGVVFRIPTTPPSEARDISSFYSHRAVYEQLRTMLFEDRDVDGAATWGVYRPGSSVSRMPPEDAMPPARFQQYIDLFTKIGATRMARRQDSTDVDILVWGSGFAGDTRHVGIEWLDHEPINLVVSLDEFYRSPKPRSPVYRHITGNWYIWADW